MITKTAIGIIPARYDSIRFPGKALVNILGKPLIQHVWESSISSKHLRSLIVATDNEKIYECVNNFGGKVVMTSLNHRTGTDRIAEVAENLDADLIVNIQGDEPLMSAELIDEAIETFSKVEDFKMGTAATVITDEREFYNPNVVKVVIDKNSYALYFSRCPIPYRRRQTNVSVLQHIGFYVYDREFLIKYAKMPSTDLEMTEELEQLRALENGIKIKVLKTTYKGIGVDTPEDIDKVILRMKQL